MTKPKIPEAIVKLSKARAAMGDVERAVHEWNEACDARDTQRLLAAGMVYGDAITEAARIIDEIANPKATKEQ